MTTRELPPAEWARLKRTGVPPFPAVRPDDVSVVVVEDEEKVVGCVTVLRAVHFEGLWIDPGRRGNAGIWRSLITKAHAVAGLMGTGGWVFAGAEVGDQGMADVLSRMGANKVPMETYVLALGGGLCRKQ